MPKRCDKTIEWGENRFPEERPIFPAIAEGLTRR